jgi:hypothetical protein
MQLKEPPTATRLQPSFRIAEFKLPEVNGTAAITDDMCFKRAIAAFQRTPKREESTAIDSDTAIAMFVDSIEGLADEDEIHEGRVAVFSIADKLFRKGDFDRFNLIISRVNVDLCRPEILLTLVRCASLAGTAMAARDSFYKKVRTRFARYFGVERTARLLDPLK